jgi:hypothetical protein
VLLAAVLRSLRLQFWALPADANSLQADSRAQAAANVREMQKPLERQPGKGMELPIEQLDRSAMPYGAAALLHAISKQAKAETCVKKTTAT